ncbi:hypothetical protein TcCL_ESM11606, partial [Trypanosoma cruzi]
MNNSKTQERPVCVERRSERARPRPQHSSHGPPRTHWVAATSQRPARIKRRTWVHATLGLISSLQTTSPPRGCAEIHSPAHKCPLSHASQAQENKYTHCPFFRSEERSSAIVARCYCYRCAASRECGVDNPSAHHDPAARLPRFSGVLAQSLAAVRGVTIATVLTATAGTRVDRGQQQEA